jgi:adenine-specific DNA-methyltransferase
MTEQEQEYLRRIHELEQQISRLQTELKKNSETQYGLRWMDVPEAFDDKAENAVPILEEIKEKAITSEDGKPTHILIEGDNYHALTCLNYTHKGAIDVIYIDPPYNTGSDGFVYKDKRVLDKFPDGTTVPTDHPLRHSYWLSFMHKRLQLAKNLLSKRGVIFISIDDNEQANLKLLCDQVFGEKNFISTFIWHKKTRPSNKLVDKERGISMGVSANIEYIHCYASNIKNIVFGTDNFTSANAKSYKNPDNDPNGPWITAPLWAESNTNKKKILYLPDGTPLEKQWFVNQKTLDELFADNRIHIGKNTLRKKVYLKDSVGQAQMNLLLSDRCGTSEDGTIEYKEIMLQANFTNPKPIELVYHLINILYDSKSSTILDFFAGSGTTMHATMQLNEEDGGHRQCILVTNNENQICEKVTYERNRRVMQGYTNAKGEEVAGLGNSLKYYRTAFVGNHDIAHINDADKVALTQKAGCLLALGENTLEEISTATTYQIFQLRQGDKPANGFEYTAIYFSGNLMHFADFRHEIEAIQQTNPLARIAVYVFTWGDPSIFENEFDDLTGITIKPIPQPILEIYQNIHKL